MKVSSREGDLSGCTAWGPRAALPPDLPSAACGLRRPASGLGAWEGAWCRGGRGASGPGRRVTWAPERPRRSPGRVRPGRSRKVSSLQVSINEGTNEPFRPFPPAKKV